MHSVSGESGCQVNRDSYGTSGSILSACMRSFVFLVFFVIILIVFCDMFQELLHQVYSRQRDPWKLIRGYRKMSKDLRDWHRGALNLHLIDLLGMSGRNAPSDRFRPPALTDAGRKEEARVKRERAPLYLPAGSTSSSGLHSSDSINPPSASSSSSSPPVNEDDDDDDDGQAEDLDETRDGLTCWWCARWFWF